MTDGSYAVQHFGVSPKSIVDCVYNVWFDYTEKCLETLKTALQDKASGHIAPHELEAWVDSVFREMVPEFNKNAEKLEEYMKRYIVHVPSHVLLPEDWAHRLTSDERKMSVSFLKAQFASLQRQIAQESARQHALSGELARQGVLREQLKVKLQNIEEMAQRAADENATTRVPAESIACLNLDTPDAFMLLTDADDVSGTVAKEKAAQNIL